VCAYNTASLRKLIYNLIRGRKRDRQKVGIYLAILGFVAFIQFVLGAVDRHFRTRAVYGTNFIYLKKGFHHCFEIAIENPRNVNIIIAREA
jgi:hypothetical protein